MTTDRFEDRLLEELKQVVARRAEEVQPDERADVGRRRAWAARPVLVGGAAATLAIGAGVVVQALGTEPAEAAWSVREPQPGWVVVEINEFTDAEGLERALEEHGISAEIDFLPPDTRCQDDRYAAAPGPHYMLGTYDDKKPLVTMGLAPDELGPDDTFVFAGSKSLLSDMSPGRWKGHPDAVGFARGPVAPCEPVPSGGS